MARHVQRIAGISIYIGLLASLLGAGASAAPRQLDVLPPGGFLNACAAPSGGGGGFWAGDDISGQFVSGSCDPHFFDGLGASAGGASSSGPSISNSSAGAATMGWVQMGAENHSPAATPFAQGIVNGGYSDSLTVHLAGHDGQPGYLLLHAAVTGSMEATAETGAASIEVVPYVNKQLVSAANPGYDDGSSNHLWSTDRQVGAWGVASAPDASLAVDEVITFSLPVVVGQGFELGIYADAAAGQRSSGGFPGWSANSQVSMTSFLAGASLMLGDQNMPGFSITSASGLNWAVAAVPEPASAALMLAGLLLLARRRHR